MVVRQVMKSVVIFVVIIVVVLFGNLDFGYAHNIYGLLGKMHDYSLRFG